MVSGYGTDSELDSTGNSEVWILTSPLSMSWLLSFPMIAEITGLVLEVEVLDLEWASGGCLLHSLGDYFGSSTWTALNWFIFLLILGGSNFGPWMMHASDLCPILPQHPQILFCLVRRSAITGWISAVSLLMEYEGLKWWELLPEVVNVVGALIISR